MSRRLIIHALNVHQGGGRTLLLASISQNTKTSGTGFKAPDEYSIATPVER